MQAPSPTDEIHEPTAIGTESSASHSWSAIVLAGQRPGVDPLAESFGETYKALIPVAGEPMLARVLRTLSSARSVSRIIVLAQDPELLRDRIEEPTDGSRPIAWMPSSGGISESIQRVAGTGDAPWPVLVTTADNPLLSIEMIEAFIEGCRNAEVAAAAVESRTLLGRYPQSKRTWLRFADGAFSGANLFAFRGARAAGALEFWSRAEQDRKQAFKLFWHFGPWLALRAITRTIGLALAVELAGRRLGVRAALVVLNIPEAAIDVDKASDHQLVEQILGRCSEPAPAPDRSSARLAVLDRLQILRLVNAIMTKLLRTR
jgi:CTP:molybdopterin cytidylyltransferase MocA